MGTERKIAVFLVGGVTLATLLFPVTALADAPDRRAITTADELLQFAQDVNAGDYDGKTDVIVSLESDLDLSGVNWTPIGCGNGNGGVDHCFSGKFYGNGHTVSNLDYSSDYGRDVVGGFFGYIEDAEVSSLKVTGNVNVTSSNNEYSYFGTIAGYAVNSTLSDCVSEVSFANNANYIYGAVGMIGLAEDSQIEYCENHGNLMVTGDMGGLYTAGIVGYATGSEIRFCANTGAITSAPPHSGGIAGELGSGSKILNCYSTGNITAIGRGITDIGGIAGTVNAGATVSHCYFSGNIDLSQYTATAPYGRLGGITGKSDAAANYENNYFAEAANVASCGGSVAAGTSKAMDYMQSEDFYNEINAGGGSYQYNAGITPVLPGMKYNVSFAVTPANLANVIVKVNGQEVSGSIALAAGTYTVEVTADSCAPFSQQIIITADKATHAQTLTMNYQSADYTKVDEAIAKANALNRNDYIDFTAVDTAIQAVDRTKNVTEQAEVDAMAQAIENAIAALQKKSADSGSTNPTQPSNPAPTQTSNTTTAQNGTNESAPESQTLTSPKTGEEPMLLSGLMVFMLTGSVIMSVLAVGKKRHTM